VYKKIPRDTKSKIGIAFGCHFQLVQTSKKMMSSAYDYFRLHLRHDPNAPDLADKILAAAKDPNPSLCKR